VRGSSPFSGTRAVLAGPRQSHPGSDYPAGRMRRGLSWALAVWGAEVFARAVFAGRARAWIVSYGSLAVAAGLAHSEVPRQGKSALLLGFVLALVGYPSGRRLLGDAPTQPPQDDLVLELVALGAVVPLTEERVWGSLVEPELGVPATAGLFALKHVAIDGRGRRALGLGAFWTGLGLVRRRAPAAAAALHCACNAGAVLWGHIRGLDQF
jgi:hypothetical protein